MIVSKLDIITHLLSYRNHHFIPIPILFLSYSNLIQEILWYRGVFCLERYA